MTFYYFILSAVWVNLFTGGDFSVGMYPKEYVVHISTLPSLNTKSYPNFNPGHFHMEYEFACVHIHNGKSNLQYVKTFDDKVTFERRDGSLVVFSVKYRPVGKKRSYGEGTAVGIGQKKYVVVGNFPTPQFGLYGN